MARAARFMAQRFLPMSARILARSAKRFSAR
jgi:hypothetical protein